MSCSCGFDRRQTVALPKKKAHGFAWAPECLPVIQRIIVYRAKNRRRGCCLHRREVHHRHPSYDSVPNSHDSARSSCGQEQNSFGSEQNRNATEPEVPSNYAAQNSPGKTNRMARMNALVGCKTAAASILDLDLHHTKVAANSRDWNSN